ncbi:hypothetical protein AB1Y20_023287 [Prymnesium parvum]
MPLPSMPPDPMQFAYGGAPSLLMHARPPQQPMATPPGMYPQMQQQQVLQQQVLQQQMLQQQMLHLHAHCAHPPSYRPFRILYEHVGSFILFFVYEYL